MVPVRKKVLKYGTPKPRKRRLRRTSAGNRLQDLIRTANRNRNLSGKPLFRLTKSRGGGVNVAFGAEGGPTEGFATTFDVGGGPPEPFEIPLAAAGTSETAAKARSDRRWIRRSSWSYRVCLYRVRSWLRTLPLHKGLLVMLRAVVFKLGQPITSCREIYRGLDY